MPGGEDERRSCAAPDRGELADAGDALTRSMAVRQRAAWQVELAEQALRRRRSWLRPAYRLRLVREARERRAALAAAEAGLRRAGRRLDELQRRVERWREQLAAAQLAGRNGVGHRQRDRPRIPAEHYRSNSPSLAPPTKASHSA
jgi:hypothetical protein